ncbi:unnamed protein product [Trichobilharzia regenti]|nr:unnamed protein product [Trichobilharzia regenti]
MLTFIPWSSVGEYVLALGDIVTNSITYTRKTPTIEILSYFKHLIDSKDLYHGTNKVLDKNDDPNSKGGKSFGLLTTIKCQSPKSVNSVTVPCILEESREPLDEKTSATTLSLSPLQDNFVVNNEQSSGSSVNQPLFVGGFINKITEVNNEQSDCSSGLTKTCTRKPLDSKGEEPHSKDTTSNKLLPYLTSTQVSSHHIFPQHLRGFYQSPQKTLVSDDVNVHNSDNLSSGMNVSSISPLMTNSQTNSKHDIRPVLQSSNFPASTSISFQSWMAQTSASNASNSSNNHYHHSHNHHFSVLHPIGVMPSPNMFDFNHEQSHFEQNDARSFNGHLYFSSRSPLQSLSQQNVFKKSLMSTNTTSTSKQENTYSFTGNQHSISPQILPVVTCSAYSANQYGTNTKSNISNTTSNHNQFPLSRLRNSDSEFRTNLCAFVCPILWQSRNDSSPTSDSASEVNLILGDRLLNFSKNKMCRSRVSTTKVSSAYLNHISGVSMLEKMLSSNLFMIPHVMTGSTRM